MGWSNSQFDGTLVIPTGATSGARIVIDGDSGRIEVYDDTDARVAVLDSAAPAGLTVGTEGAQRVQMSTTGTGGNIVLTTPVTEETGAARLTTGVYHQGLPDQQLIYQLTGGQQSGGERILAQLLSESMDGSRRAGFVVARGDPLLNVFTTGRQTTEVLPRVPSGQAALFVQAPAGHTGAAFRVIAENGEFRVDTSGALTNYAGNAFADYIPDVGGAGSATFSARTGWSQRVGKMRYVCVYLGVSGAGSGSDPVTVTMPTPVYRGTRQTLTMHTELLGPNGAHTGTGECVFFMSGTGAVADRLRTSSNDGTNRDLNITGADLLPGGTAVIEGWYREA